MVRGIRQLSAKSVFDLIAYNQQNNDQLWKPKAVRATTANRHSAETWVQALLPIEDHCMISAMKKIIDVCNRTPRQSKHKRMIFMGNRQPFCGGGGWGSTSYGDQVIEEVTAYNTKRVPIDTIYVPEWPAEAGEEFWRDLAAANRGSFTKVIADGFNNP